MEVHHVEVKLWTSHAEVSTTAIKIRSPAGTGRSLIHDFAKLLPESYLAWEHGDKRSRWDGWRFLSRAYVLLTRPTNQNRFWGEKVEGKWELIVDDKTSASEEIEKWTLILHGNDTTVPIPYVFPAVLIWFASVLVSFMSIF